MRPGGRTALAVADLGQATISGIREIQLGRFTPPRARHIFYPGPFLPVRTTHITGPNPAERGAHCSNSVSIPSCNIVLDRAGSDAFSRPELGTKFSSSYPTGFELVMSTEIVLNLKYRSGLCARCILGLQGSDHWELS